MSDFIISKDGLYISYKWLIHKGINRKTIENWKQCCSANIVSKSNHAYVLYSSIPEPSRLQLPTVEELKQLKVQQEREERSELLYQSILSAMRHAYEFNFPQYRKLYEGIVLDGKVTEYARNHAVWKYFLDTFYSEPGTISPVKEGWKAYNELYPGKIGYSRFKVCVGIALKEGIQRVLVRRSGQGRKKVFTQVYEYWVMQLASSGKAYSRAGIQRMICDMCNELGYKTPSYDTVQNMVNKWIPIISESRYGKDKDRFKNMGYVSIIPAENANDQWQVDGWKIPFYAKVGKDKFCKLCLFWVLDAHSRRVVGYKIAETENTETILDGIEDAVRKTGALPFEIVSDNHSFNQTAIAETFKVELEKLGVQWTVTENPRYKALVERSFGVFAETICKEQYGYIGQGIKTKNPDGRTSQELFDQYTSGNGWLDINQIKAIIVYCVDQFNKRADKQGKNPISRYEESAKPNEIRFDNIEMNANFYRLFTRDMKTLKVRNNQLKITRAGNEYEYQLTSELAHQWNNKEVRIRYIDLLDSIYIYNPETDEALGTVNRKRKAHGAKANQTDDDAVTMSITKAVNEGVRNRNRETISQLYEEVMRVDPEAAELLNQRKYSKNIIEDIRNSNELRTDFERNGGDIQRVPDLPIRNEFVKIEYTEKDKKKKKKAETPFHAEKEIDLSRFDN